MDSWTFIIGYFAVYYRIVGQLSYVWFSELPFAVHPRIVDVHPQIVNALAFLQTDKERQEEADKFFFHNQFAVQLRFIGTHLCHGFARLLRGRTSGKGSGVCLQGFFLVYIEGEAAFIISRPGTGLCIGSGCYGLFCPVVEMLICLGGVGQYLVCASIDVDVDV